jgi:glycosyltransferase involved in cell wall biosynthesis
MSATAFASKSSIEPRREPSSKRLVYLDIAGRMHPLYKLLLEHPPEGFLPVLGSSPADRLTRRLSSSPSIFGALTGPVAKTIPVNLAKAAAERFKKPPKGTAVTVSNGHLVFRPEPWVVDLEFVTQLAGYNYEHFLSFRRIIQKRLASSWCRSVISWTLTGARTVTANLDSVGWGGKVRHVPLAVPKRAERNRNGVKQHTKLLFVGSLNIPGQFELKGGMELLAAFEQVSSRYDELELVMRSDIPAGWVRRIPERSNIRVLDQPLPWSRIESEFESSDIFVFPSYNTPGLVFLDAMSYGLPVVTTDIWGNSEMILSDVNGIVIPGSKRVRYAGHNIPLWGDPGFRLTLTEPDSEVVESLVDALRLLIEDQGLRSRLGRNGRDMVENGRYSLRHRNELLRAVLEEACRT